MAKVPNGLQEHLLWEMDGRTWIEPAMPPVSPTAARARRNAIKEGWATPIPKAKVAQLVKEVKGG